MRIVRENCFSHGVPPSFWAAANGIADYIETVASNIILNTRRYNEVALLLLLLKIISADSKLACTFGLHEAA